MRYVVFFISTVLLCTTGYAQDEAVKNLKSESEKTIKKDADTLKEYWKKGGIYSLTLRKVR